MAYTVRIYKFNKRKNSTKQPPVPGTTNIEFSCQLMDGSGMLNPTFRLDFSGVVGDVPQNYNYAYVSEWNRYYFIADWEYNLGLWNLKLSVDVLASWQSDIGGMTTYILRSASNYDRYLPDNTYPVRAGATYATEQNNLNPFATAFSDGYFVAGLINNESGGYGPVNYYVFTAAQFRSFSNYLLSNVSHYNVTDVTNDLLKVLMNPFQYVVSCTWLPFTPPTSGAVSSVGLGWWSIPVSASKLSGYVRAGGSVTCQIPRNPEGTSKQFMYGEPYTEYYLDFPPFGSFSISADQLINATFLDMGWDCDCITGVGRLQMGANSAQPFNIVHAQVGVPVQLAQMGPQLATELQQALGTTGWDFGDRIMETVANIGNALLATKMPMQSTGSTGGFMAGYYPIKLTGIFHGVAAENLAEFGAPCCKTLQIGTLSGYVQCAHGEFDGKATDSEIDAINNYLTSGFFYE